MGAAPPLCSHQLFVIDGTRDDLHLQHARRLDGDGHARRMRHRPLAEGPDAPADQQPFVLLQPVSGDIYLGESWLRHEVLVNSATEARISVSFNDR